MAKKTGLELVKSRLNIIYKNADYENIFISDMMAGLKIAINEIDRQIMKEKKYQQK